MTLHRQARGTGGGRASSRLGAAGWLALGAWPMAVACSGSSGSSAAAGDAGPDSSLASDSGALPGDSGAALPDGGTSADTGGPGPDASSDGAGARDGHGGHADGGLPTGWLYTSGSTIKVSDGAGGGAQWMGRGVNVDDIFLCGFNNTLAMLSPDKTLETMLSGLMSGWKPTFVRISLGMASYIPTSWSASQAQYKTPMTAVIDALGTYPGLYVLVTLRSDGSMIGQFKAQDPEATGLPSDSTTTPNATTYPTGTDATYVALVDSFASASYVLFGLSNEPGGNGLSSATIAAAMSHAVGVIRAEEDRLGVPHHVVSVQGNSWTSDISVYAKSPLPYDNVVYEVHGYPPSTASYTVAGLPVILGEYGSLTDSASFYADVEAKQIPNLAWDFEPFSNCSPDLLTVNQSSTNLVPTAWGTTVQKYLLAHP